MNEEIIIAKLERLVPIVKMKQLPEIDKTIEALHDPEAMKKKFFSVSEQMSFDEEHFL